MALSSRLSNIMLCLILILCLIHVLFSIHIHYPNALIQARVNMVKFDDEKEFSAEDLGNPALQAQLSRRELIPIVEDIDHDGRCDHIGVNPFECYLSRTRFVYRPGISTVVSVGADDIDGNGTRDLWRCDSGDSYAGILFLDGTGKPLGRQIVGLGTASASIFVNKAFFFDVDGDGQLDLCYEKEDGGVWWRKGIRKP